MIDGAGWFLFRLFIGVGYFGQLHITSVFSIASVRLPFFIDLLNAVEAEWMFHAIDSWGCGMYIN